MVDLTNKKTGMAKTRMTNNAAFYR